MHPILFRLGPVAVPTYALVVLAAMLVALALVPRSARRNDMDREFSVSFYFWVVAAGIVGARLFHLVMLLPRIPDNPSLAKTILVSGGVWYGGLITAFAFAWFFLKAKGVPYAQAADMAAVPVIVGGGLGRLACFLSGCCFGSPTDVPWAVTFTDPVAHRLHADLPWVPIHPVQLYELAGTLVIATLLDWMAGRRHRRGTIALTYIALYGALRFVVEMFRGDLVRGSVLGLSTSQAIGLVSCLAASLWLLARRLAPAPRAA